jgi:hypothetical protein
VASHTLSGLAEHRAGMTGVRHRGASRVASREDFVPDEVWVSGPDGFFLVPLRRADDPRRWLELCRGDQAITIQAQPSRTGPGSAHLATGGDDNGDQRGHDTRHTPARGDTRHTPARGDTRRDRAPVPWAGAGRASARGRTRRGQAPGTATAPGRRHQPAGCRSRPTGCRALGHEKTSQRGHGGDGVIRWWVGSAREARHSSAPPRHGSGMKLARVRDRSGPSRDRTGIRPVVPLAPNRHQRRRGTVLA